MIKVQSQRPKTIYPSLKSISDNPHSNYYLMEVENQQTNKKAAKVITKGTVADRSIDFSLNDISLYFDGIENYINLDNLSGLLSTNDPWSIGVWFKTNPPFTSDDGSNIIFSIKDSSSSDLFRIGVTADNGALFFQTNNTEETVSSGYDDGVWHRLFVTRQSGNNHKLKVYVNGAHVGNTSNQHNMNWTDANKIQIGSAYLIGNTYGDHYKGWLKDFQLWGYTLDGDDIKFDYNNPDLLASDRRPTAAPFFYDVLSRFKMNEGTGKTAYNSYYSNLIIYPNEFQNWTKILASVTSDVTETKSGFKIADKLVALELGPGQAAMQLIIQNVPSTGNWKFGAFVKGKGKTVGKNGKFTINLGTASGLVYPESFIYTDDWVYVESYVTIAVTGSVTLDFEFITDGSVRDAVKGDEVYVYGAKFYNPDYNLNGTINDSQDNAAYTTEQFPMFSFQDNSFYNYKIYEQTSSTNTDIYSDTVIGLRQSGKLFVEGDSEVEYIKQTDADSTNEVYLKI